MARVRASGDSHPLAIVWFVTLTLQIYTRWVNQKLSARLFPTMTDVLKDLGQDDHLSNLVTALSEKEMPKPAK